MVNGMKGNPVTKKPFYIVNGDISDGYHTFEELYDHRVALYLALCKMTGWPAYYKKDYESWICVYLETPEGQVSYHVPSGYLDMVQTFAKESPDHKWDNHTSNDVLYRILKVARFGRTE
jgi:hypothetical protein